MLRFLRFLLVVVLALVVVYFGWRALAEPRPEGAFRAQLPDRPLVIAHQGGDGLWPSNTMYAFENAVRLGADILELDVHQTRDGVFVAIHDATVDRTTDGAGAIRDMSLAEVQALDAGWSWSVDGESYPYRNTGLRIPTLLELFAAFPDMPMNVEIKPDDPGVAVDLCRSLRSERRTDTVLVASFHDAPLAVFRKSCPAVATAASPSGVRGSFVLSALRLSELHTPASEAYQVPVRQGSLTITTQRFIDGAHARNVDVHVWTIDEEAEMRRLLAMGVDGIITDRPDRLVRVLGGTIPAGLVPDFVRP
jgi:glycerophosphoryl diester phosphodiesterase